MREMRDVNSVLQTVTFQQDLCCQTTCPMSVCQTSALHDQPGILIEQFCPQAQCDTSSNLNVVNSTYS